MSTNINPLTRITYVNNILSTNNLKFHERMQLRLVHPAWAETIENDPMHWSRSPENLRGLPNALFGNSLLRRCVSFKREDQCFKPEDDNFSITLCPLSYRSGTTAAVLDAGTPVRVEQTRHIFHQHLACFHNSVACTFNLDHPNILKNYCVNYERLNGADRSHGTIFMERADNFLSLRAKIFSAPLDLTNTTLQSYFAQMIQAIDYLHSQNIPHLNINLDNILISGDQLKLICTKERKYFELLRDDIAGGVDFVEQTRHYFLPPEAIRRTQNGIEKKDFRAMDIWSCGVMLYFLLYQKLPFDLQVTDDASTVLYKISTNRLNFPANSNVSNAHEHALLLEMLKIDPKDRIHLSAIKSNPWVAAAKLTFSEKEKVQNPDLAHKLYSPDRELTETKEEELSFEYFHLKNLWGSNMDLPKFCRLLSTHRMLTAIGFKQILPLPSIRFSNNENTIIVATSQTRGTSLLHFLGENERLNEKRLKTIICNLLIAIKELHKKGINLRKFQPSSIFIDDRDRIYFDILGLMNDDPQNLLYRAPEDIYYSECTEPFKKEIWSIGIMLAQMMGIPINLEKRDVQHLIRKIFVLIGSPSESEINRLIKPGHTRMFALETAAFLKEKGYTQNFCSQSQENTNASSDLIDFVGSLLRLDPKERLDVDQALQHRWFADIEKEDSSTEITDRKFAKLKEYREGDREECLDYLRAIVDRNVREIPRPRVEVPLGRLLVPSEVISGAAPAARSS
jgi:serine/threonine protein kinase